MKLQPDKSNGLTINAYGPGWIEVNGQKYTQSLIVSHLSGAQPIIWRPDSFQDLEPRDFEIPLIKDSELVIFGSGKRLRFVNQAWLLNFVSHGIGVETMDTAAACRTYNILASEGRKVLAILLMES